MRLGNDIYQYSRSNPYDFYHKDQCYTCSVADYVRLAYRRSEVEQYEDLFFELNAMAMYVQGHIRTDGTSEAADEFNRLMSDSGFEVACDFKEHYIPLPNDQILHTIRCIALGPPQCAPKPKCEQQSS